MKNEVNSIKEAEMGTLLDELFAIYNQVNPAKEQIAETVPDTGGF